MMRFTDQHKLVVGALFHAGMKGRSMNELPTSASISDIKREMIKRFGMNGGSAIIYRTLDDLETLGFAKLVGVNEHTHWIITREGIRDVPSFGILGENKKV